MRQLKIIDNVFYRALIGLFSALVLYNLYATISMRNLSGILPLVIQSILMYFLITKHPIAQRVIKIWIIVFLWGAQALRIIGVGMQLLSKNMKGEGDFVEIITSDRIIYPLIFIIVGMIIWVLNKNFGEIVE